MTRPLHPLSQALLAWGDDMDVHWRRYREGIEGVTIADRLAVIEEAIRAEATPTVEALYAALSDHEHQRMGILRIRRDHLASLVMGDCAEAILRRLALATPTDADLARAAMAREEES